MKQQGEGKSDAVFTFDYLHKGRALSDQGLHWDRRMLRHGRRRSS